jgi:hypothetical protein
MEEPYVKALFFCPKIYKLTEFTGESGKRVEYYIWIVKKRGITYEI